MSEARGHDPEADKAAAERLRSPEGEALFSDVLNGLLQVGDVDAAAEFTDAYFGATGQSIEDTLTPGEDTETPSDS